MSHLINRVIILSSKKTCLRLEENEWKALDFICKQENIKRNKLFDLINTQKNTELGLTYAVRLFSVIYFHQLNASLNNFKNNNKQVDFSPLLEAIKSII